MAKWNTIETPDNATLEDGIYRLNVENIEESGGTDEDPRPLAIEVTFTVEEPVSSKGFFVRRRFWLGSREDPKAEAPQTRRSKDWTSYKNFVKSCDVTPSGDTEEEAIMLKKGHCLGKVGVRHYTTKDDKAAGPDENGRFKRSGIANTVFGFYKLGTKEVGYDSRISNGLDATAVPFATRDRGTAVPSFGDDE